MKKLISLCSALLILGSLKAQKSAIKKETLKPAADTLVPKAAPGKNNASSTFKKTQKDAKLTPAIKKSATEFKNVMIKR